MANTMNGPPGPFTPYVGSLNADDPLMKRVPFKSMDIGANAASMPGVSIGSNTGSIEHVGKSPTKA